MARATHEMVDEFAQSHLARPDRIELLLEHAAYSLVQTLAPGLRQAGVGDVLGNGVGETVTGLLAAHLLDQVLAFGEGAQQIWDRQGLVKHPRPETAGAILAK